MVFDLFRVYHDTDSVWMSRAVRSELNSARKLLPLAYGDVGRRVLPVVVAQDAEGESNRGLGGWGLGVGFPPPQQIVSVALSSLGRGIPKEELLALRNAGVEGGCHQLSDLNIPSAWTDGSTRWYDLLARAHSYQESIHLYEARTLLRSIEIIAKCVHARRSHLVALEDNSTVVGAFARGRSPKWPLNNVCRRKCGLELASDIQTATAWLGTTRMPMDKLSRVRIVERAPVAHAI